MDARDGGTRTARTSSGAPVTRTSGRIDSVDARPGHDADDSAGSRRSRSHVRHHAMRRVNVNWRAASEPAPQRRSERTVDSCRVLAKTRHIEPTILLARCLSRGLRSDSPQILDLLRRRELRPAELGSIVRGDPAHACFHLRVLRQSGLITTERRGGTLLYRSNPRGSASGVSVD
jgi:DNA-binding transcriptional ArsR family regulator